MIEINLVDHCNLNCQMCDHFSQLAAPYFLDVEEFRRDMERLAELSGNHIDIIKLQGGEPLLHPEGNQTIALRHGKLYTCSVRPYANYFNEVFSQNLELSEEDGIDIYKAKSYEEIAAFVANRISFCRYCDIKNRTSINGRLLRKQ